MNLIEGMLQKSTVENTKGGEYYSTTYNKNLDLYSKMVRYDNEENLKLLFRNAMNENAKLAIANLLYILDIRNGKGERRAFKIIFKELCFLDKEYAQIVLSLIPELGRWDYILEGLYTPIRQDVLGLIKSQLKEDINSEHPSLLGKWLPTLKSKENGIAVDLCTSLDMTKREYRKMLVSLREKLNIIERNLSQKRYDGINLENVPTKAILKYRKALAKHLGKKYTTFLDNINNGNAKVNTKGLFCYDIIKKIMQNRYNMTDEDRKLFNAMWEQQKDIFKDNHNNILTMADTSGSMYWEDDNVIATSIGLALYTAARNNGIFKDYYMTFSSRPLLQKVSGIDIVDKYKNVEEIAENTDIDKAFELLLETAKDNSISQEDMPSHILIVSDMEFDRGVYSQEGTNFNGWKKAFSEAGYKLPQIIFWNLGRKGFPVTRFDNDVCMISGFSTSVLENLLKSEDLVNLTPTKVMLDTLNKYIALLEKNQKNV